MRGGRQRVAFVTPFFGRELRGRKERFAFAYATHLALEGVAVEVITTTTTPDAPDANFFQSGTDQTEPFPVHRFRVDAPDRVAYEEAQLAARRGGAQPQARALLAERVRSPGLLAHVRASADRYDAFLCLDVTVPTTVHALADVAERLLLVPLLDDEPAARLPEVAAAVSRAPVILCTTDAEALLVAEMYGPAARSRTRIVGLGVDVVPRHELNDERVHRVTHGRPYILAAGDDAAAFEEMRRGTQIVALSDVQERDRAAFFAYALAVAVSGAGLGFVPEVVEAWAYGKPVLAGIVSPGASALIRETGGGIVVAPDGWADAVRALPGDDALATMARAGAAYVEARGGWRRVASRTSEAIDGLGAFENGRSRDALLAQVAYLYPLAQRQRRTIEAMRVSRFWRLRDAWFALKRRVGIGPAEDPIPLSAGVRGIDLAALGDPYQLFREHHRLRGEDVARMRATARFLPRTDDFGIVIDARASKLDGVAPALRSLQDQFYARWSARVLLGADVPEALASQLQALAAADPRIVLVEPGGDRFGDAQFVGALQPHDTLEPHALFELTIALQDDDADVIYTDEDVIDERGTPSDPWFKPDWSPDTLLTRDYVGRFCVMRRELLERAGGVRDVFESANWYEALLRVSELTERIAHVPQVLCHRSAASAVQAADAALAVEVALRRRGETASVQVVDAGVDVRFAVPGDERVCIIIPTRDRADLLGPCIASVFERTAYRNFEMIVVDNGSRQAATRELLAEWSRREPERFRVLRDAAPFNYSRLNNAAVASTDAPYVLLLNNDTEVIAPEWIEAMLGQARRPRIGAVGALLLYPDGTVQHAGVVLGILGLAGHVHRFLPGNTAGYHGGLALDTNYLAVTGACLMVQRRKYLEAGGLDETLAVSYNDIDLCLRLRRAGYRNVLVPRARLYHYESKSRGTDDTPAKVARAMEEAGAIRARWPAFALRDPYYNPNLTADAEDFGLRL